MNGFKFPRSARAQLPGVMHRPHRRRCSRAAILALTLLAGAHILLLPGAAVAADQTQTLEDRLRLQLRSTSQQLAALQSEQAQTQAARNAAEAKANALQEQVKALESERDVAREHGKTLEQQQDGIRTQAQSQIEAGRQQVGQFRQAYDQLLVMAKTSEAQRAGLQAQLARQNDALASCTEKNQRLYTLGNDVLRAYEGLSTGSLIQIRQPFATSARVKFDEIAQSFGDKLYDNRADARPAAVVAAQQK